MNYANINKLDVANGEGIRTSLFVSGCNFHCKGCFNEEYQNPECGELYTQEIENKIIQQIKLPYIKGLSLLGGEPMLYCEELVSLCEKVKRLNKNIWCWTGYKFEELIKDDNKLKLLNLIDVLVDGQFIEELRDLRLYMRGSRNQRVIDVKKSLKTNQIVLYHE